MAVEGELMDATTALPTGTVTFLFTDIEDGGAALWPRSGQRRGPGPGTRLLEQQPEAMQQACAAFGPTIG
jgi:hypothetical protein